MDVAGAVIAHRFEVEVLEDVKRLKQRRALGPVGKLVYVDAAVSSLYGLLDMNLPFGQVCHGDQSALLYRAASDFASYVASVKTIVRCVDSVLSVFAGSERRCSACTSFLKVAARSG